jgi:Arc/MetJ family transcription regulator
MQRVDCIAIALLWWYILKSLDASLQDGEMRTNIVIDDQLLAKARRLTGIATKKGAVDAALKLLVRLKQQEAIRTWWGKLRWDDDLEARRQESTA